MSAARNYAAAILPLICSLLLFAAFSWLGAYVTVHGEPPAFWTFAKGVRGHSLGVAWALTNCGWPQVLAPLYAACIAVAIWIRAWRTRMVYLIAVALTAWVAADRLQVFFARPRRLDWLIRHETAFSYPSSHAAISTAFYLVAAVLLLCSESSARVRYPAFVALTAVWLGILWSRLSLAAHYPTDVAGGVALGAAIALLGAAVVRLAGKNLVDAVNTGS